MTFIKYFWKALILAALDLLGFVGSYVVSFGLGGPSVMRDLHVHPTALVGIIILLASVGVLFVMAEVLARASIRYDYARFGIGAFYTPSPSHTTE